MKKTKIFQFTSAVTLMFVTLLGQAEQKEWFRYTSLDGFVSQTFSYSSDYNFFSESDDDLAADLWEAGALINTKVIGSLDFSAQVLGRRVSQASGNDVRVDYAFLSLPFVQTAEDTLGARVGRIRSSYGLYNETRDIPHTRTGILMPQSVYYDMTRNSFYSSDGVEFFAYRDLGEDRLSFQVFVSKPVADEDETEEAAELNPRNLEGKKSLLAKISFGSEFDGFRYALTYYKPEYEVDVSSDVPFDATLLGLGQIDLPLDGRGSDFSSQTVTTSIEYNQLNWSLTAEYSRHKFDANINIDFRQDLGRYRLTSPPAPLAFDGLSLLDALNMTDPALVAAAVQAAEVYSGFTIYEESYYLQGLYRFSEQWEAYLRYDTNHTRGVSHSDKNAHWKDYNIGGSFRPDDHWLFRAELHHIQGRSRLLKRDNQLSPFQSRHWQAGLFQIAYRF